MNALSKQTFNNNDAAVYLGLAPKTLPAWRVLGKGPRFCKVGRRVVYRRADLDEWLDKQTRHSTSDAGGTV